MAKEGKETQKNLGMDVDCEGFVGISVEEGAIWSSCRVQILHKKTGREDFHGLSCAS